MKKQITQFSPHQNAKVFALLITVSSLFFILPIMGMQMAFMPSHDVQGNPISFPYIVFGIFPVLYLIFGYLSVAFGCWVYNLIAPRIGGFEYESQDLNEPV